MSAPCTLLLCLLEGANNACFCLQMTFKLPKDEECMDEPQRGRQQRRKDASLHAVPAARVRGSTTEAKAAAGDSLDGHEAVRLHYLGMQQPLRVSCAAVGLGVSAADSPS